MIYYFRQIHIILVSIKPILIDFRFLNILKKEQSRDSKIIRIF
jgi:uncharacterized membrane protein SirB2